jgi:predicted SprT family Zn-dependent metalloprotease
MKKIETSLRLLENFLPAGTYDMVIPYFSNHTIHLTLTHERKTVLGDYRNPTPGEPFHRVSVNINLNKYSFLITLLHELAHMMTYVHFQNKVAPHGQEWKTQFRHVLIPFIGKKIFPQDVEKALVAYIHNPAASTCSDQRLYKALYQYDERKPNHKLVDELEPGHWFECEDRVFEKLETLKTRSRCRCISTGKVYLFQGIMEVKQVRRDRRLIA